MVSTARDVAWQRTTVSRRLRRMAPYVGTMERPMRSHRIGLRSLAGRRSFTLHELHKFVLGVIHHLCGNRDDATFLRQPLDFLPSHRTDEVGNIVEALLRFRRPRHAIG